MSRFLNVLMLAVLVAAPAAAGQLGLGREAAPDEIAAWDIDIRPDGAGLPEGSGTVTDGEEVFVERCAICHGDFGEGRDRWPVLAGGEGSLTADRPEKTIGSYWPYLSTVWDYVHRAMPFGDAQSLTDDEVYAITAYILYLNDLVDEEFELSRANFAEVRLPNEENFFDDPRPDTPLAAEAPLCMSDCKDEVKITMRAAVLDVTPEDGSNPTGAVVVETGTEPVAEAQSALDPALAEAGAKVYKKCKGCHQVGEGVKNRAGPHLNGVLGRTAGSLDGFRYSKAMTAKGAEGLVWTAETLNAFLEKPKSFVPKTKMSFKGLKSADDRAAIAAYLSQFTE
ncbi:MAG: c-type cytochrome [Paracoccaceae bacterium]|nr:c-type cytochrome [Paracoccaceae bacterium]